MSNSLFEKMSPYGIGDLSDFDTLSRSDEYYPYSQNGMIIDEKVVYFMLRLGYVYDFGVGGWYILDYDGLFQPVTEEHVKIEIMRFLHKRAPSGVNIPLKSVDAIFSRLKACSYDVSCLRKFDDFIINHDEYEIPYGFDGCEFMPNQLIPVKNGLINPATMELLPHCAYLLHHNVYNFNYRKLSEDEILYAPERDVYSMIIPDKPTLELFLWWAGMVLFSRDLSRVLMVLYGTAGTGKTTLSLGISKILTPDKSLQLNFTNFQNSKFMTAEFVNKQLVVIDELPSSKGILDDATIKQYTGGTSNFVIEEKYKQPRNVSLSSKFLFIGNNYPQFIQDNALYERLFIIECAVKQDRFIRDWIVDDDHLNWLFNAAHYYYVVKHPQTDVKYLYEMRTPKMLLDLDRYRDTDMFVSWIKDYLSVDDVTVEAVQNGINRRSSREVFKSYQDYVLDEGGKPVGAPKFNQKLYQEYGLEKKTLRGIDGTYKGYQIVTRN